MWSVWGVTVLFLLALKLYTARLTRDEDNQIILQDSFDHLKVEQAAIAAKVNRIEPVGRIAMWLTVGSSLFVAAYYAHDIFAQLV
jgi:hypothetical protein